MLRSYAAYEFQSAYQRLNALLTVDLSAFYIDISKDRLYTLGARSLERRSAQTALYRIVDGLTRVLAPILPVTAEELWRHLPGSRDESVHLTTFPTDLDNWIDDRLTARWARLLNVRDLVNAEIEKLRQSKVLGTSLQAHVHLRAGGDMADLLEAYRDELPMFFIASHVSLERTSSVGESVSVEVRRTSGMKCERCWRYVSSLSDGTAGICPRCEDALAEAASRIGS
jgi:isoleucyl-tRNA synthetase